jgi:rhombotail lipoprotein
MKLASLKKSFMTAVVCVSVLTLAGCAAWFGASHQTHRNANAVDYLYPDAKQPPNMQESITTLRPPVRVGIAFAPDSNPLGAGIPEQEKMHLLDQVKAAFAQYEFIGRIEVIPSSYLRPRGGFDNLEQAARMFDVEVVALLSYDQVQFADTNSLAVLYWTIVGAYIIHGDQYDVQTLVDASVFDVASRKLLFRAPGTSVVKGSASMAGFSEQSRQAQVEGYRKAVAELIPALKTSLSDFRERIKNGGDTTVKVENRPGYGGGDLGWLGWLLTALAALVYARRKLA